MLCFGIVFTQYHHIIATNSQVLSIQIYPPTIPIDKLSNMAPKKLRALLKEDSGRQIFNGEKTK